MFVHDKKFQPSQIYVANPEGAPLRQALALLLNLRVIRELTQMGFTKVSSSLKLKNETKRKKIGMGKHASLFCPTVSGEGKSFINIDTLAKFFKTFYIRNILMFVID